MKIIKYSLLFLFGCSTFPTHIKEIHIYDTLKVNINEFKNCSMFVTDIYTYYIALDVEKVCGVLECNSVGNFSYYKCLNFEVFK